jgi:hypothetical protein
MIRTALTLYMAFAAALGPRVCCVMSDGVDAASRTALSVASLVVTTRTECCGGDDSADTSLPFHSDNKHDSKSVCHNISREFVAGDEYIVPNDFSGELLHCGVAVIHYDSDIPGNNAFARLDSLGMLRAMHILRC